ncbi:MAG: flagellar hook-length control protein FliK [Eubacterium sp.]|nr:flagellar hook-length control protein FliK [Eubacterium sp.]
MQITDMLNQYNRNIANGTEISSGTQGIKQVVSSIQEMSVGNVFEGNINQIEDGVVTLGLGDGKTIQAKLDSGVTVHVGESMFFQVRSNSGSQIAIRPFSGGNGSNPTLLNALKAANLPVNGKTLTMVHTMMEQSMSIDKQSLMQMARFVMGNEGMDVTSIVQMAKLGIPVTEEMIAQFENYKSDQYAILDQMESMMEILPEQLAGGEFGREEMISLNRQILQIFLGEPDVLGGRPSESLPQGTADAAGQDGTVQASVSDGKVLLAANTRIPEAVSEDAMLLPKEEAAQKAEKPQVQTQEQMQASGKHLLNGEEFLQLSRQLAKFPQFAENPAFFSNGQLRGDLSSGELLQLLEQVFSEAQASDRQSLSELVSSKEYRTLVRNMIEQQWLLKPEELKSEHKVNELYERLDRQLEQMERVLKSFGQSSSQLSHTAANVRDNIQFMNQLNQTYAYVQIPLKLAGQNAHSELFVYTDKRKKREKDGEFSAFLHLDLDHLGSTDVSIKLHNKQVATNFYLADDLSYQLILEHLNLLEERLKQKGYQAKIQVMNQEENVNFVEDILKRQTPSAGGMVHRYSFDVRA